MRRRVLLTGMAGLVLARLAPAIPPSAVVQDYQLERFMGLCQSEANQAACVYRKWSAGQGISTPQAVAELVGHQSRLQQLGNRLPKGLSAELGALVGRVRSLQVGGVGFLLAAVRSGKVTLSQAEMSQRWRQEVAVQRQWLEGRGARLAGLVQASVGTPWISYYQWRASLQPLLLRELALAEQLAGLFEKGQAQDGLARQALQLAEQAQKVRAPRSCRQAQQSYQERFQALGNLIRSAQLSLESPDSDTVANLQADEALYRERSLACELASVSTLGTLLGNPK